MEQIIVEAAPRETRGKNAARRLRVAGTVPAVLYGGKGGPQALQVNTKQVSAILRSASGHNTIFTVKTQDAEHAAIVKEWQVDPVKGTLLHVDLLRVAMDVRMRVKVPVHVFGEAQGVKLQGGVFEMVTREVEIECLPADIPTEFRMDISALMMGMQLRASDIPLDPQKMKIADRSAARTRARRGPARRGREARRGRCRGSGSSAGRARAHQEGQEGSRRRRGRRRGRRPPRRKRRSRTGFQPVSLCVENIVAKKL